MRLSCGVLILFVASGVVAGQNPSQGKISLVFEANRVFSGQELLEIANKCLLTNTQSHDSQIVDYCLWRLKLSLASKGYLRASVQETKRERSDNGWRVIVRIDEGARYRLGAVEIKGSKIFSPLQIREMLDLKLGDIADGEILSDWLHGRLKKAYEKFGYIQYAADLMPRFRLVADRGTEGIVDLAIQIDEGKAFTIQSIVFQGNEGISADILGREMLVRKGEVFNKELFNESLVRLNQMGLFEGIDADKDVAYRVNEKDARVDITIHLKVSPSIRLGAANRNRSVQ